MLIKMYFVRRPARYLRLEKIEVILLEKKIKSVLDYIKHTVNPVWLRAKNECRKPISKNFGMVSIWKKKKKKRRKTSKFVDAESHN